MKTILVVTAFCLFAGSVIARKLPETHYLKPGLRSLDVGPDNFAVDQGDTVVLECAGTPGSGYRVQWTEYAYSSQGTLISENGLILDHPQKDRYQILQPTSDTFNLQISNIQNADGGTYVCQDVNGFAPQFFRRAAQLIVISSKPNCTTTVPTNGQVIEGDYHTIECIVYYKGNINPVMTISGPNPFRTQSINTTTSVWAGADWYVNRSMETSAFTAKTNFTNNFFPVPVDSSTEIPDWEYTYQGNQMFVSWRPTNMYVTPVKPYYDVGDVISCYADAFPAASYAWQNMRTLEFSFVQGFYVTPDLEGTDQTMRCQATNIIFGNSFANNFFYNVSVPLKTTTPPPTLPPTTTTAPPVSNCFSLTGVWTTTNPYPAKVCFNVDLVNNGVVRGMMKNGSDTFLTEVYGKVKTDSNNQIGFSGIWPASAGLGASSFVGECYRCYGTEILLIKGVSRALGDSCTLDATINYSPEYTFNRVSSNYLECMLW
jgi:hypothetical protein